MISNQYLRAACLMLLTLVTFVYVVSEGKTANAKSSKDSLTPSAIFPANAGTLGAITDGTSPCWNPGTGPQRNVTFTVSGVTGAPTSVEISMTFGGPIHPYMGDITATLLAPNGASHVIFGHTGAVTATSFGDSSDLGTTYTFSDNAPSPPSGGWWQAATAAAFDAVMPTGTYRTTNAGGAGATNPMPPTNMNTAFAGVANPNGTWTLRLTDSCAGDTGAISGASLTINAAPRDGNVDLNGDGKTDYVVARGTTNPFAEAVGTSLLRPGQLNYSALDARPARRGPESVSMVPALAPPIYWYSYINGTGATGVGQVGDAATDFLTPEDFDGDGKDDLVVWTEAPAGSAHFKIFQSSTNTFVIQPFGQTGDDPAVVGDYDGDHKADPAVYRCPGLGTGDGQCFFFYRGSLNNPGGNVTYVPWGFGEDGDFFPNVGDFDGDEKNDFCIQRANPAAPTQGQFVLLRSSDLGVEFINWGLASDFIIPGDYDGDNRSDFCVRRTVSGNRQHWILHRTGATAAGNWGITGDSSVPGDYDGDGKTDMAIWRGNSDPNQTLFWVFNSGSGSISALRWGLCPTVPTCDFAVAGWAVH